MSAAGNVSSLRAEESDDLLWELGHLLQDGDATSRSLDDLLDLAESEEGHDGHADSGALVDRLIEFDRLDQMLGNDGLGTTGRQRIRLLRRQPSAPSVSVQPRRELAEVYRRLATERLGEDRGSLNDAIPSAFELEADDGERLLSDANRRLHDAAPAIAEAWARYASHTAEQATDAATAADTGARDLTNEIWRRLETVCSAWQEDRASSLPARRMRVVDRSRSVFSENPLSFNDGVGLVADFLDSSSTALLARLGSSPLRGGWVDSLRRPTKPAGTWARPGAGGSHPVASVEWRGRGESAFSLVHELAHLADLDRLRTARIPGTRAAAEGFATATEVEFGTWAEDRWHLGSAGHHGVLILIDTLQRCRVLTIASAAIAATAGHGESLDAGALAELWTSAHEAVYGRTLDLTSWRNMWVLHPELVLDPHYAVDGIIACGLALASRSSHADHTWWTADAGTFPSGPNPEVYRERLWSDIGSIEENLLALRASAPR